MTRSRTRKVLEIWNHVIVNFEYIVGDERHLLIGPPIAAPNCSSTIVAVDHRWQVSTSGGHWSNLPIVE